MYRETLRRAAFLAICCVAAGCRDGAKKTIPEDVTSARHEAARRACISAELAQDAEDQLQILQKASAGTENAALTFARAYEQRARVAQATYAQLDSARNHSSTPKDSTRHEEAAASFTLSAPEPGTVEANVAQDYERRFAQVYNDADHPCNWKAQLGDD
ncbi:MAG TPA: hypothetical protein VFL93_07920 [Longimicrobiaceae bacterium]|jgi:hypothetical protein|nr:hypothetical protein [Longimicrobiaceae bacterium]